MRKVIISTVFMLLFSSICHALTLPEDMERWHYFFDNQVYMAYIDSQNYHSFYNTYIDKNNIIHRNHHIITIWKWAAYHSQNDDFAPKDAAYSLEHVTYDMTCKVTSISWIIYYDKNHSAISSSQYDDFIFGTVPGTIAEAEIEAIQKYDSNRHNEKREAL